MCVKETSPWGVSYTLTKHMFDRKKKTYNNLFLYIFLGLPPYNSNFWYYEIKSLSPRILNLLDTTCMLHLFFLSIDFALYYYFRWQMTMTGDVHAFDPDTCSSLGCVSHCPNIYPHRLALLTPTVYERYEVSKLCTKENTMSSTVW